MTHKKNNFKKTEIKDCINKDCEFYVLCKKEKFLGLCDDFRDVKDSGINAPMEKTQYIPPATTNPVVNDFMSEEERFLEDEEYFYSMSNESHYESFEDERDTFHDFH